MLPRRRASLLLVPALLGLFLLVGGAPASAAEPQSLTGEITDQVGALDGQEGEVQAALDKLAADTPYQLYVVYVSDFGGADPKAWARETATQSGLGSGDFVLAVATDARRYALVPESTGDLSSSQVQKAADATEDKLRDDDWAGAAITAADTLREQATGGGSSGAFGFGGVLVVGLLVIGGFVLFGWLRGRSRRQQVAAAPQAEPADELAMLPTAELDRRSSTALVAIDDALRTSEQELGFAQAQFGPSATKEFEEVLAGAKQRVTEAFRLRQTLDDDVPDSEPQVRETATRILRQCQQVAADLEAQKAGFDHLRDLEAGVDAALTTHERTVADLQARIEPARAVLTALAAQYPASALASVQHNPEQARLLLDEISATILKGRDACARDERRIAVGYARATEEALGQVTTLLDAVDRAGADLATIGPRLDAAVASISSDLADVRRLAAGNQDVAGPAATATAAIETARTARGGTGDPLAALRTITDAEAALDAALAPMREADERARRALGLLDDLIGRLDSTLRATSDFVATRRGAIGPEARTRLAEAERLRSQALDQRGHDPERALESGRRAQELAVEAQQLAQADVDHQQDFAGVGGRQGGGFNNVGGMVLGGILLDSILRGGGGFGGGHHGGGWSDGGGGGWGGGGGDGGGGGFGDGGFGGGF
ncbi:membrane protein [Cellulomonas chitinilytica]|uniref:Membrane protein n=1 Tax=Cellulomonas chitinilytica TaxID=398759 RepID=A0A919U3N1_9CELL|nr:TPM domain-containing protein [Cellulomonas chitinilytica]GIG22597.1 membrane protein [Cellulomonas chitinilytica]